MYLLFSSMGDHPYNVMTFPVPSGSLPILSPFSFTDVFLSKSLGHLIPYWCLLLKGPALTYMCFLPVSRLFALECAIFFVFSFHILMARIPDIFHVLCNQSGQNV